MKFITKLQRGGGRQCDFINKLFLHSLVMCTKLQYRSAQTLETYRMIYLEDSTIYEKLISVWIIHGLGSKRKIVAFNFMQITTSINIALS